MKRWFTRGWVTLVIAVMGVGGWAWLQVRQSLPQLDGQLHMATLSAPVQVQRDRADVTHIQATTALDAWRALGFVHAQERGWQMEFNRRLMHGELSEILGPATLDIDKMMRTLGIMAVAKQQLEGLSPSSRQALQAYSDGVQAAYAAGAAGRSPEFQILRLKPAANPWLPEDSVGWALMMALDLGGNWGNEAARFALSRKLSTDQLWTLMPPYPGEAPASPVDLAKWYRQLDVYAPPVSEKVATQTTAAAVLAQSDWVRDLGTLDGKGSNNWVVPGQRTTTGKPMLANDPHLALSAPAIWYFAHLQAPATDATPALDVIGATLPGLPFVVLGRTRGVAWGFTNTGPDVQDLYLEEIQSPGSSTYRTAQGWASMSSHQETIRVKGQGDVTLTVRSTRHGPVVSDVQALYKGLLNTQRYVMALRWSALEIGNKTVDAGLQANFAQTVPELVQAYRLHHSPMQSVVMADTLGETGFKAIGQVPLRSKDNDLRGVAPAPGWMPAYDWTGWLPYDKTPSASDAEIQRQGWYATANQRIISADSPYFLGSDWTPPERFDRIGQLLQSHDRIDMQAMADIQHDVLSLNAQALLPYALKAQPLHPLGPKAMAMLEKFDARMTPSSGAAAVLNVWAHELTSELVASRVGDPLFAQLYGKRNFRAGLLKMLSTDDTFWCQAAGCQSQINGAMDRALTYLQSQLGNDPARWHWGDLHPAISAHKPFDKVPLLRRVFSQSIASGGDNFTINVGQYWANEAQMPFASRHAPSLRALYDLAQPENSLFIYQTGQSGHPFDPRSRDMAHTWAGQGYRPLQMQPARLPHALMLVP